MTERMARRARPMANWLKFIGVVTILAAVPSALSIIGLVVAWLPIWLGVLLFQAGMAAERGTEEELLRMTEKLRVYFVVQGVLIIVGIVVTLIFFLIFGGVFFEMIREMGPNGPTWEA